MNYKLVASRVPTMPTIFRLPSVLWSSRDGPSCLASPDPMKDGRKTCSRPRETL